MGKTPMLLHTYMAVTVYFVLEAQNYTKIQSSNTVQFLELQKPRLPHLATLIWLYLPAFYVKENQQEHLKFPYQSSLVPVRKNLRSI